MKKIVIILGLSCGLIEAGDSSIVERFAKHLYFKGLVERCTGQNTDLRMNGTLILDAGAINIFFNGAISGKDEISNGKNIFTISVEGSNQRSKIYKYNDENILKSFNQGTIKSVRYASLSERFKIKSRMLLGSRDNEMSTKSVDFIVPSICIAAAAGVCYYFSKK